MFKFQLLFLELAVGITVHQNLGQTKRKFDTRRFSLSLRSTPRIILRNRDRLYDSNPCCNLNAAVVYKPENKHS